MKRVLFSCVIGYLCIGSLLGMQVENGVLDLRQADLAKEQVPLTGTWAFYWGELLSPEEVPEAVPDYFPFPELWNGATTTSGRLLESKGYATYYLQVLLPARRPELALRIKHVYSAGIMFVNGRRIAFGGEVGVDEATTSPKWVPAIVQLPDTDTLDLVLQIANFMHQKGGAREAIVLGSEHYLRGEANEVLAYDLLLAGTLIMTGLFFVGLYFFGQNERSAIFFSIFCLTFAYRLVGADDYTFQIIHPDINWLLSLRLEYLALFVPPIFFALYTHSLFPFRYRVNPFYVIVGISTLFAVISVFFPPEVFTSLVDAYLIILMAGILCAGYIYIRAFRSSLGGAKYALISSFVILMTFSYKIFTYAGAAEEIELISFIGYLSFFFFQSLILFFLFTSSLKRARDHAEHASKTKSEFLSMMSHEIRTPMNAVVGLTNYLIEDNPSISQKEILDTLRFSAKNLLVIIDDILDFSKIEANKIEFEYTPVNIRDLISSLKRVFSPIAIDKNLEIHFDCDPAIPEYIECDQTRTSQVLTNLISNAIKFTQEGAIRVGLSLESLEGNKATIKFQVKDTGIGIEQDRLESIFQSFTQANTSTTRQYGGTGLGLTITRKLLNLQGSELYLWSEVGKGSEFWFSQEFRVADNVLKHDEKEERKKLQLPVRILLVEDNQINVMVATKFLSKWGADVAVAQNGQEAIRMVYAETFNIILMDLQMPVMDGYEAALEMRKMGIETPIIALTASALADDQKRIKSSGMDDFIVKPFDPDRLYQMIADFT